MKEENLSLEENKEITTSNLFSNFFSSEISEKKNFLNEKISLIEKNPFFDKNKKIEKKKNFENFDFEKFSEINLLEKEKMNKSLYSILKSQDYKQNFENLFNKYIENFQTS